MLKQIRYLSRIQLCNLLGLNEIRHTKDKSKRARYLALALAWVVLGGMLCAYVVMLSFGLAEMGMETETPQGAFYVFPSIEKFGLTSAEFCTRMIREAGLAATPGFCFGSDRHIRLTYCYADAELEEGLNRLERFIQTL